MRRASRASSAAPRSTRIDADHRALRLVPMGLDSDERSLSTLTPRRRQLFKLDPPTCGPSLTQVRPRNTHGGKKSDGYVENPSRKNENCRQRRHPLYRPSPPEISLVSRPPRSTAPSGASLLLLSRPPPPPLPLLLVPLVPLLRRPLFWTEPPCSRRLRPSREQWPRRWKRRQRALLCGAPFPSAALAPASGNVRNGLAVKAVFGCCLLGGGGGVWRITFRIRNIYGIRHGVFARNAAGLARPETQAFRSPQSVNRSL